MDMTFYDLSKIAWAILSPTNFLILLATLGLIFLLMNKTLLAKWLLMPSISLLFAIMSLPIGDYVMLPLEKRFQQPTKLPEKIDGIIILGGGEDLVRSVSWWTPQLGNGGERFIEAARLAKHYPQVPVIYTSASGNFYFDTNDQKLRLGEYFLHAMEIKNDIIYEDFAKNTHENFVFIKPLLPDQSGNYLLVTSAFHMPRSVGIARQNQINVIPYPVDYRSRSRPHRKFKFQLYENMRALEPAVKEWIGLTVYYWTGKSDAWFPKPPLQKNK